MFGQKIFSSRTGRAAWLLPVAVGFLALISVACGSSAIDTSVVTTRTSTSTPKGAVTKDMPSSDAKFPQGLRNVRYCEVLLLNKTDGQFVADVWNTLGMDDCPQKAWDALDATAIAKDRGAILALLNGPRYWTLDAIVSDIRAGAPTTTFDKISMFKAATVKLGKQLPKQTPYVDRAVARETVFQFRAGKQVYELTDDKGKHYVMQSYSLIKDKTLTIDRLANLGPALALPEGWSFRTRVLEKDLDVLSTDGIATVIQDDLQNSYQRIDEPGTK